MQNAPSQTAVEADYFRDVPDASGAADTPSAAAEDTRERVSKTVTHTSGTLTERLRLLENKLSDHTLTVQDLESLSADFCTYMSYKTDEDTAGLNEKMKDFYSRLKALTSAAENNANVGGTNNAETDSRRRTEVNKLVERLDLKFAYFLKSFEPETRHENLDGWFSG